MRVRKTGGVIGIFDSVAGAERAKAALQEAGVSEERMQVSQSLTSDALASEAPGESFENQPGQAPSDTATAKLGEAVRSGVCTLHVDADSEADTKRIERLLLDSGARNAERA